jgi:flagellar M-ring protein FliF
VGTVTRLTIAVLVDEKALRATPSVRLESLEGMVRDAVGADSTRGDRVTVMAVPFEQATLPVPPGGTSSQEKPKVEPLQMVERYGRPAVNLVAIIILAVIALQAVRMMGSPRGAAAPAGTESAPVFEAPLLAAPVANSPAALLRNRLQAETAERPETMAQVLRAWLSEN